MERFDGWDTELYHFGIKGQKWGIRRYQNPDGTLTDEGRAKYGKRGFYREVKNAANRSYDGKTVTSSHEILSGHPKIAAAREKIAAYKEESERAIKDFSEYQARNRNKNGIRYIKKTGELPKSELDLYSVDRVLSKKADYMDKATGEFIKRSEKEAQKLLGRYGKRSLYSFSDMAKAPNYEVAKKIVAKAIRH